MIKLSGPNIEGIFICGSPRYLSVHPGGVVITPNPINEYVPVERATKGVRIIQWEKDQTEESGLVKIDLLGNRSLGVIRDAINNLTLNGTHLDECSWEPEDDFDTAKTTIFDAIGREPNYCLMNRKVAQALRRHPFFTERAVAFLQGGKKADGAISESAFVQIIVVSVHHMKELEKQN